MECIYVEATNSDGHFGLLVIVIGTIVMFEMDNTDAADGVRERPASCRDRLRLRLRRRENARPGDAGDLYRQASTIATPRQGV